MSAARRSKAFTLIELMIVVAIIGILAAIAIPNFLLFQTRSKITEGKMNIASIRTAEESYFAEHGTYIEAKENPNNPTPLRQKWLTGVPGWATLGWAPEGELYFQYGAFTGAAQSTRFNVEARSDLDGDGVVAEFAYIHPSPGSAVSLPLNFATTCSPAGVYNAATGAQDLLHTVGPCTARDGQTLF